VDGQETGGGPSAETLPVEGVEVDRDGRRVPVVGVDDIGLEAERRRQFQGRAAQQDEPAPVVPVPLAVAAVKARPGIVGSWRMK
jgi:hypothetical protein